MLIISSPDKKEYSDKRPNYTNKFHVKELYKEDLHALLNEYFDKVIMYGQRSCNGSFIGLDEDGINLGFQGFYGDYPNINSTSKIPFPALYNIFIASNSELKFLPPSFYVNEEL